MNKKIVWLILSCLMVSALVLTSCGGEEEEVTVPTEEVTVPTEEVTVPTEEEKEVEGNWWDVYGKPQYGGTIIYPFTREISDLDPGTGGSSRIAIWYEMLTDIDWKVDRKICPFNTHYKPLECWTGLLAESWDVPDLQTIIFHIRKGVHWQDKPPVNGREFTAYDVEYHYHRITGTGSGFTEPTSQRLTTNLRPPIYKSVTATDKYTVVFKSVEPSLFNVEARVDNPGSGYGIEPREVIEKHGDAKDWKNVVGTGPFILVDHVAATSYTCVRNPNYWGYDELHPQNRLPYADTVKFLIIPDLSTRLAGLRTGKIDLIERLDWEQAGSLAKTNPELIQQRNPNIGRTVVMRCDNEPFSDIKVRTALQMAIDRETIGKTYFGGNADPTIVGYFSPLIYTKDYYTPLNEQPKEVQEGYAYNPEGAKELLAEAGYPNGFKTNVMTSSETDLLLIVKDYFAKIGVDMEIRLMDAVAYRSLIGEREYDAMCIWNYSITPPRLSVANFWSENSQNYTFNNDPVYDEMYLKFLAAPDWDTSKIIAREANDYAIAHHWNIVLVSTTSMFIAYQPYLKGYAGEDSPTSTNFAHWWIDQDLKKAMGR